MARQREIVAKRGCTCCGTGCVLLGGVVPLSVFVVWETVGVVAAVLLWPALLALSTVARRR